MATTETDFETGEREEFDPTDRAAYSLPPRTDLGRATKYNQVVEDAIIEALSLGSSYKGAANYVDIQCSTLFKWLKLGREGVEPYTRLVTRVRSARQKFEVTCLKRIHRASEKNWQAAAWLLERRLSHRYGQQISEKMILRYTELRMTQLLQDAEKRIAMAERGMTPEGAAFPVDYEKPFLKRTELLIERTNGATEENK